MKTILQRTVSGIVYLILIIGSLLWGCIPFGILLLCIGTIALYEFYRLTNGTGNSTAMIAGLISGCLIIIIAFLVSSGALKPSFLSCDLLIILMLFMLALFTNREKTRGNLANQLLGVLYISVPLAVSTYLIFPKSYNHEYTYRIILGTLILIWINDTVAYIAGITLGSHRLYKKISPKKSWEGVIGGTIFTIASAVWMMDIMHALSRTDWLIIACIVSVFGVTGDLFESMFKRELSVKDSGNLIPGHGGILDRIDSMLFVMPAVFIYLLFNNL